MFFIGRVVTKLSKRQMKIGVMPAEKQDAEGVFVSPQWNLSFTAVELLYRRSEILVPPQWYSCTNTARTFWYKSTTKKIVSLT